MKKTMGFQRQLSLGFSLISLVSMVLCGVISYNFTSRIIKNLTIENLKDQIGGSESAITVSQADNILREKMLIEKWAPKIKAHLQVDLKNQKETTIENQVSHETRSEKIPSLLYDNSSVANNTLADEISDQSGNAVTFFAKSESGFVRVSTSIKKANGARGTGTFIDADSPVYKSLISQKTFIGRAQVLGKWYTTAYEPIVQNDVTVGAFFMGSQETSYDIIRDYLKKKKILDTGYFYIMDSKGTMVLHPTLEGQTVFEKTDVDGKAIFKDIISQKSGVLEYRWQNADTKEVQNKLAVFRYFPEVDWYLASSLNMSEAEKPLQQLRWILFSICTVMTMLMALMTVLFGKSVVKKLSAVSVKLSSASHDVQERSTELSTTSALLASSTTQQAAALQQTAVALEEIRATVNKNLENTVTTRERSSAMAAKAQGGKTILDELSHAIESIKDSNQQIKSENSNTQVQFTKIVDAIARIESKTQDVNAIVFQTKLLSFNASVEAARAGEHGKGFAVVAEEVGRLAALTGTVAQDISLSLTDNQSQVTAIIQDTMLRMNNIVAGAQGRIEEAVQISNRCQETFNQILTNVSEASEAVSGIALSSSEQAKGVEEIGRAVNQIDTMTQQNSRTAQKVLELSSHLDENADDMNSAVLNLGEFVKGKEAA